MRNELATEYDLPDMDGVQVNLEFVANSARNAWLVSLAEMDGPIRSAAYGATPLRAFQFAKKDYTSPL